MKRDLHGKRILVTGASSGIGQALAEEAARQGARVVAAARSADKLNELAQTLTSRGQDVLAVPTDITIEADRERLLQVIRQRYGGLDVLINNAGIASQGHFSESSEAILRQIMEVNFFAPAELIRLAVPLLIQGQQPAIVNVASMTGRCAMPAWPEYSASKHALCGLTEALRGEMVRFGIDVLLVLPGLTRTNLDRNLLNHNGRMAINFQKGMAPEKVAQSILRALRKNRAETVLGLEALWLLRVHRLMPWLLNLLFTNYVRRLYANEPRPANEKVPV
jgi:short-subunit dehydrogenase